MQPGGRFASTCGAISVIEFGVAGGDGLLALEREAEAVEKELGVSIRVYGFDNGPAGLPAFIGDHRDHPDKWKPGDFPMDEPLLRSRLGRRTTLVLGNVEETVPRFFDDPSVPPVGFIAFDLDLYSSTASALRILSMPGKRTLDHVALYFDDIEHSISHHFAGELLAIDEFNRANAQVKIDRWRGIRTTGRSRRPRTCERCTWPTTSTRFHRGSSTGGGCIARSECDIDHPVVIAEGDEPAASSSSRTTWRKGQMLRSFGDFFRSRRHRQDHAQRRTSAWSG